MQCSPLWTALKSKSSCELDETVLSNIVFCMIISYYAVIFVIPDPFWMTIWGDWIVDQSPRFLWYALLRRRSRFFRFGKPRKLAQKQKSRRRALKRSTIDFRGTHVVCIGAPLKSRQNAIFLASMDIPESGVPSTTPPRRRSSQKEINRGILGKPAQILDIVHRWIGNPHKT